MPPWSGVIVARATGMVVAQADCSIDDAIARTRECARAMGRTLERVAAAMAAGQPGSRQYQPTTSDAASVTCER
jgi:hypothetical protein